VVPLPQSDARVFGRYALYDEIASGGMATVHIGRLLGPVGFSRTVAIKRLHAQFAKDPDFVSMFLDEARLAARIRHPNVIGTLDVVALEGELFLVMEYVPGESLARLWRTTFDTGRTIPLPIVSAILVGVLDGLHAAHEATDDNGEPLGIVHRDVSPHNILVGTDGMARVLDFGVAKAAGRLQSTHNGQLKGKISYMAPEQVQGTVDRTSDVYSASVVLWEALTGKRLFFAETQAKTLANVLYPRVEAPGRVVGSIPRELDAVVMRGLDPNPAARFPSAREMGQALQRVIPPATAYDVGDWVEATAGRMIAARATRVAMIARSAPSESGPRPLQTDESSMPVSQFMLRTRETGSEQGFAAATGSSPSAVQQVVPPSKGRVVLMLGALVLVAAAIGFVAFRFVDQSAVPFGAVPMVATVSIPDPAASTPSGTKSAASAAKPPDVAASATAIAPIPPAASPAPAPAAISSSASAATAATALPVASAPRPQQPSTTTRPSAASPRGVAVPTRRPAPAPAPDFDHVLDSRH
jgi:eukaryotic-like serine/threonine-protein kinase